VISGEDAHQSRLASAVLAEQRMDFTRSNVKRHLVESGDRAEALHQICQLQERGRLNCGGDVWVRRHDQRVLGSAAGWRGSDS
jgi:hypothetical protein